MGEKKREVTQSTKLRATMRVPRKYINAETKGEERGVEGRNREQAGKEMRRGLVTGSGTRSSMRCSSRAPKPVGRRLRVVPLQPAKLPLNGRVWGRRGGESWRGEQCNRRFRFFGMKQCHRHHRKRTRKESAIMICCIRREAPEDDQAEEKHGGVNHGSNVNNAQAHVGSRSNLGAGGSRGWRRPPSADMTSASDASVVSPKDPEQSKSERRRRF